MSCNCRRCREESKRGESRREYSSREQSRNEESRRDEEIVTCPTETEVRTTTREKIIKHIHPKEIINVHKTIIKHEHCFPVHERDVFETVVEGESGCGGWSDRNRCRRRNNRY